MHRFIAQASSIVCTARILYRVFGGWLIQRLFVRHDVERIFRYRAEQLRAHFGG